MNTELITIVERTLPYLVGRIPDSVTQALAEFMLTGVQPRDTFNMDMRTELKSNEGVDQLSTECSILLKYAVWLTYVIEFELPDNKTFQELLRLFCADNNIPETT